MTFSFKVKEELCKIENKKICCDKAQCYASLLFLKFFFGKKSLHSEHKSVLRLLAEKLSILTNCIIEIKMNDKRKINSLSLSSIDDYRSITDFFNQENKEIELLNLVCDNCRTAFLRGVFLACGTISDPKKQYKLEFSISEKELSESFETFLKNSTSISFKKTKRRETYVFYTKDSSSIEDFLTLIGATNSSMELMQEKMYKEATNRINRQANFETANIDKTITASANQIACIMKIAQAKGWDFFEKDLSEVAACRIDNPEMSLKNIAEKLCMSRSSINHKLNKIIRLAEKI
ncbi:MAG: DNA-binding protein WhiA [Clostridia bacterium]